MQLSLLFSVGSLNELLIVSKFHEITGGNIIKLNDACDTNKSEKKIAHTGHRSRYLPHTSRTL